MSTQTILTLSGTSFVLMCGVVGLVVALWQREWQSELRPMLATISGAQFFFVANRLALVAGLTGASTTVVISGYIAAVTLAIELNLLAIALYTREHELHEEKHKGREHEQGIA